jgi:hypothetical protein
MNDVNLRHSSRRRFIAAAGLGANVAFMPRLLFAQKKGIVPTMIDAAAQAKIETPPLRRGISVLEGSGGNIAVLTGKDGKLLIDSGFRVSKTRIVEALNDQSADPITQLINTHSHVDHTDGNDWVHSAGAAITAHVNTKKHLSTSTRVEGWQYTFPPSPAGALPATVFDDEHRVHHNNTSPENVAKYGVLNFVFEKSDLPSVSGAFRAVGYGRCGDLKSDHLGVPWMWITLAFLASKTKTPFLREKSAWRESRTC